MALESRLYEQLNNSLQLLPASVKRLVLAFSGGIDSCVLLHLLSQRKSEFEILIWHVNHGLIENADEMEMFCEQKVTEYGLELNLSHLHLDGDGSNIEARARIARYQIFTDALGARDCLLTAHHADDQAETFFLNLLRGSGSAGLRGIAAFKWLSKTPMLRPLLSISRADLEHFAEQHQLNWFEDPSNQSERFNRNYLRSQVMPVIKNRWPGYLQSIASVCAIQSETQDLLDDIARQDYQLCQQKTGFHAVSLNRNSIDTLSNSRQKNLIRYWLRDQQWESLSQRKLEELVRQLGISQNNSPVIWSKNYCIRAYQDKLFIVPHSVLVKINDSFVIENDRNQNIGQISLNLNKQMIIDRFKIKDCNQSIEIKFRTNLDDGKSMRHRLKHLFQKNRVPPWLRDQTPLVYIDDELIGIWKNHE